MSDKIDDLLKEALTTSDKPDEQLNQVIIRRAREENNMRKPFFKTVPVMAAIITAVLAAGSLTAYGAWKYLEPAQVAEENGDKKLAGVFESDSAVVINKSQTCGGYKITLMGTVSGENLSDYMTGNNGEVLTDRTYTVVSIENQDGSPMPDTSDDSYENKFLVSPFIKGEDPAFLNIYYMNGGSSMIVEDGVEYRIIEHDNIGVFADRGVYIGVLGGTFYDREAYNFDKKTGEISRNENYKGINALFELPLDKLGADAEAAEKQLKKWRSEAEDDSGGSEEDGTDEEDGMLKNEAEKWSWKDLKEKGTLIKGSVQKFPASDFNKYISYTKKARWKGLVAGDSGFIPKYLFKKNEYGTKIAGLGSDGETAVIFDVVKRSKNGTITVCRYHN